MGLLKSMSGAALITAAAVMFSMPVQASDTVKLRDSWTPTGLQAGFYYGLEKGIYEKHGINLLHEDGNGSGVTVQVVANKQADIGFTDLSVMAMGIEKGMPLIAIGGLLRETTLAVFVPEDSGIRRPKDLEGKEVIFTATSFEAPFLNAFFKADSASRDDVNLVSVDAAAKISVYANGRGTGMITSYPLGAPVVNKARPSRAISFGDYGLVLPSYGLVVHKDTLAERPEVLRRFAAAFFESWTAIMNGGAEEAADIVLKRRPEAKLDRGIVLQQITMHIPYFTTEATKGKPLGWQADADWKRTIAAFEAAGLLKPGSEPSRYFTNRLIADGAK